MFGMPKRVNSLKPQISFFVTKRDRLYRHFCLLIFTGSFTDPLRIIKRGQLFDVYTFVKERLFMNNHLSERKELSLPSRDGEDFL